MDYVSITSTLLSLLVVPAVLTCVDDVEQWFKRRLGRAARPVAPGVVEPQCPGR